MTFDDAISVVFVVFGLCVWVYSLATGNILRRNFKVETSRDERPVFYWFYMAVLTVLVVVLVWGVLLPIVVRLFY